MLPKKLQKFKITMKCHNCQTEGQLGDKFCLHCGTALKAHAHTTQHSETHTSEYANSHKAVSSVSLPAEQAEKLLNHANKMVQHLSTEEKVMGGASIVALLAFFMPWSYGSSISQNGFSIATNSNGWYFLLPLSMSASLALLYFSQGAKQQAKIFTTTLQVAIGTYIFGMGIATSGIFSQFGLWLMILAGGVLTGTAVYFQKKILL